MNIDFNKNENALKLQLTEMNRRLEQIHLGGGKKKIANLLTEFKKPIKMSFFLSYKTILVISYQQQQQ